MKKITAFLVVLIMTMVPLMATGHKDSLTDGSRVEDGYVLVRGGTFQMGSNSGYNNEKPVHSVTVSSFYISKYEVTQKEYKSLMGSNPSHASFGIGDNNPVYRVSWYDAVEYCNELSRKEGLTPAYSGSGDDIKFNFNANGYRLPTEAEWEYAARGGNSSLEYTYSGSNSIDSVAWYSGNSGIKTHPVGGKQANELGLYDMSGNVWEWCWDRYESYSSGSQTDPTGKSSGSYRVIRGGCWGNNVSAFHLANRFDYSPVAQDGRIGFRVVRRS